MEAERASPVLSFRIMYAMTLPLLSMLLTAQGVCEDFELQSVNFLLSMLRLYIVDRHVIIFMNKRGKGTPG